MRPGIQAARRRADSRIAMRRCLLAASLVATSVAALPVVPAEAAKSPASTIKLVSPMRVLVGDTVTIRGTGFSSTTRRNTVIFTAPNKRTAFAKPRRASGRKLVVRIPGSVERLLTNEDDKGVGNPTRFRIRVVVGKSYGKVSPRRNSPVIVSALKSGAPATCGNGSDFDRDLLSNALEAQIKTDPCTADTDGDGVEDGFEQESALDLNQRALPYPGKRPFPNALDASDAGKDYDGDALSNVEEFRAWARDNTNPSASLLQAYSSHPHTPVFAGPYGAGPAYGGHNLPLNYSDGKQATLSVGPGHPEYRDYLDFDGDGRLTDDERDADGDGLRNVDEIRALMWQEHYPADEECGYAYTPVLPRDFLQVDYLETDSDGDGVWDGNDDQDNDGVSNVDEVQPPYNYPPHPLFDLCSQVAPLPVDGARDGSVIMWNGSPMKRHPYNPCLPYRSDTCARYGLRN